MADVALIGRILKGTPCRGAERRIAFAKPDQRMGIKDQPHLPHVVRENVQRLIEVRRHGNLASKAAESFPFPRVV